MFEPIKADWSERGGFLFYKKIIAGASVDGGLGTAVVPSQKKQNPPLKEAHEVHEAQWSCHKAKGSRTNLRPIRSDAFPRKNFLR